jgi:apolipoprotein N-acyltransferase
VRAAGPAAARSRGAGAALFAAAVLCQVLAFPPTGLWPLAAVGLAPLAAFALRRGPAAAFGFAWLQTVVVAFAVTRWVFRALVGEYQAALPAAAAFMALLFAAYALVPGALAAAFAALARRVGAGLVPLLFAALWTAGDWLRAGPLGLPWLLSAHPLAFAPLAIQTADLGGAYAPGFAVALVGGGLGAAAARRAPRALVLPALLAAAAAGYGALRLREPADGTPLRVGVVQAAVPQQERFQPGSARRNTLHHAALTRELTGRERLDLVVWSETAVDDQLDRAPGLLAQLEALVDETGVPLLSGAPRANHGAPANSVVLLQPGAGLAGVYDKQRLVPFSESDPPGLGWLGPLLGRATEGEPYVAGREPRLLAAPGARIAAPICFEITYAGLMRGFQRAGADLVVNLSNDAWFGPSHYAEMHLAHAPFRAVELRRWVVRGTNTGISALVDPHGRVVARAGLFREQVLAGEVRARSGDTFYARHGDAPVLLALGLGAALSCCNPLRFRRRTGARC